MKKIKAYRHGDVLLVIVSKKPTGLKKTNSKVLLQTGSSANPHSFDNGTFYPVTDDDLVIGYLKAKNTNLFHTEHSPKGGKIEDGLYEVRRQVQKTHEGMVFVED